MIEWTKLREKCMKFSALYSTSRFCHHFHACHPPPTTTPHMNKYHCFFLRSAYTWYKWWWKNEVFKHPNVFFCVINDYQNQMSIFGWEFKNLFLWQWLRQQAHQQEYKFFRWRGDMVLRGKWENEKKKNRKMGKRKKIW